MIIGMYRNGKVITTDSPDAPLIFKTYGQPLVSGLVMINCGDSPEVPRHLKSKSLLFNPDTGKISLSSLTYVSSALPVILKTKKRENAKHPPPFHKDSFISMPCAAGKRCTITGEIATEADAIITKEGHCYTKKGLMVLFSGGRRVARSPYPEASPLIKSDFFRL
jgi:hypothetical protein